MKKITEEIYDKIVNNEREKVKEELGRLGVDMTTEYGSLTARFGRLENIQELGKLRVDMTTEYGCNTAIYGRLENIKELGKLRVDMTTECGYYTARDGYIESIREYLTVDEMTLEEICKELGRNIKIIK